MRIAVLGSGAACPPAGQNSSGYLIEDGGARILLDCGHGVATSLLAHRPDFDVDHIIITHMHPDHFIDVIPLRFRITRDMAGVPDRGVTLHLPPGGTAVLSAVCQASQFPADFIASTMTIREYDPERLLQLSGPNGAPGLQARFARAVHYIPAWSVRLNGTASVAYSGDTAPTPALAKLAQGADLLLCEATLTEPETGPVKGHLTPRQAAEAAMEAHARELLLTHFWFDVDLDAVEVEARACFPGRVETATDGLEFDLIRKD